MIETKNLTKDWRTNKIDFTAVKGVDLSVSKGEFVSIIGPSGCGKTTILRLVAGLIKPTDGTVSVESGISKRNRKLSVVFQNPVLLQWRNIFDNVKLPTELDNNISKENILDKIKLVGLDGFEKSFPKELSGGMQQRAALARSLVLNPELLLLDEPFGALDEINRNKLNLELLKIHRKLNPTILFVTHSIDESVFLSDKVVILSERPATIIDVVDIDLPRDRKIRLKDTEKFRNYVTCIREKIR